MAPRLDELADELLLRVFLHVEPKTIVMACGVSHGLRNLGIDKRWWRMLDVTESFGPRWGDRNARSLFHGGSVDRCVAVATEARPLTCTLIRFSTTAMFVARRSQLTKLGLCHVWPQLGGSVRIIDLQAQPALPSSGVTAKHQCMCRSQWEWTTALCAISQRTVLLCKS